MIRVNNKVALYARFSSDNQRSESIDAQIRAMKAYCTPKEQSNPYKVTSGQYKGETMPLYKGYFEYSLMTSSDFTSLSPFYYSDGYFLEDPTVYNTHLASMSIAAAMAAFGRSTDQVGDNAYANHFANIKQLFSDIGCADVNFFVTEPILPYITPSTSLTLLPLLLPERWALFATVWSISSVLRPRAETKSAMIPTAHTISRDKK